MNSFHADGTGVSVLSASVMEVSVGTTDVGTDTVSVVDMLEYTTPPNNTWQTTFAVPVVAFGTALHQLMGMA